MPAAILENDLAGGPIQPATTAQAYQTMALVFGAIAVIGVLWGLVGALRGRGTPRPDQRPPMRAS